MTPLAGSLVRLCPLGSDWLWRRPMSFSLQGYKRDLVTSLQRPRNEYGVIFLVNNLGHSAKWTLPVHISAVQCSTGDPAHPIPLVKPGRFNIQLPTSTLVSNCVIIPLCCRSISVKGYLGLVVDRTQQFWGSNIILFTRYLFGIEKYSDYSKETVVCIHVG